MSDELSTGPPADFLVVCFIILLITLIIKFIDLCISLLTILFNLIVLLHHSPYWT